MMTFLDGNQKWGEVPMTINVTEALWQLFRYCLHLLALREQSDIVLLD